MKNWVPLVLFLLFACAFRCGRTGASSSSAGRGSDTTGTSASRALSYEERQGRDIFVKYCAVCHGVEGKGDGFNSYNLDAKPRDFTDSTYMKTLSDARLIETISQGGRGVNKSPLMPSWGATLSKHGILDLIRYLRTFSTTLKKAE